MPHILVIGSPSIDTLHFNNQTEPSIGGAGLYTALAALRSGCQVSLYGVKPEPVPGPIRELQDRLTAWSGPQVAVEKLPHFEILHKGDKATYQGFDSGYEDQLDPSAMPQDLSIYDAVHITALGKAALSLRFAEVCHQRGAKLISSGSFLNLIEDDPEQVRRLIENSDIFFLNEEEAVGIFGSLVKASAEPGKIMFITRGKEGCIVVQGNFKTSLPSVPADVLDPTGAGDSFCGATLANLAQELHPILAARKAMALAAEEVEHVGPAALLFDQPAPEIALDQRVRVNKKQVVGIAGLIKGIPEAKAFNFVSDYYPPIGHPAALDYFFAQTLQQFSFWETDQGHYAYPLIATIDGHDCKGSTYLSYGYMRPLDIDPEFYSPQRQARTTLEETRALFQADDGSDPMPALELHFRKAQDYGKDMFALDLTPQEIINQANHSSTPLKTFLSILDHIGGYKEDPFRKKSSLLALILMERPEHFLVNAAQEALQPVIDYHAMRFCLRTGLVEIMDQGLRQKIAARALVTIEDEWAIRYACYQAVQGLIAATGLSSGAVDNISFKYTREHCPEMTEPDCRKCDMDPACVHYKELFQPVIRTTFY